MCSLPIFVYPQFGGLTDSAASMMVVVRHGTLVGDEERTVTRTVDVRLEKVADGWTVSELASTGGEPPVSPAVTPTGEAALANPNLELSDTARWEVEAGPRTLGRATSKGRVWSYG